MENLESLKLSPDLEYAIAAGIMDEKSWSRLLSQGLYLERRACLLPWNASLSLLLNTPGVESDGDILTWADESILGGYEAEISTGSMRTPRGLFRINCKGRGYGFDGWPEEGMLEEYQWLLPRLGPPLEPFGREGCSWDFKTVRLSISCHSANEMYFTETWHKYLEFDVLPLS